MTLVKRQYYFSGIIPILAASVLWAGGYFIRKMALKNVPPVLLTFATSVLASGMIFILYRIDLKYAWHVFKKQAWLYIAQAFIGVVLGTTLMNIGLKHLDLGVATLLEKLQPVFTLIFASIFLAESIKLRTVVYGAIAVASSCVIAMKGFVLPASQDADLIGIVAIIGAACSWGMTTVIAKIALNRDIQPDMLVFLRFAIASILLLPMVLCGGYFEGEVSFGASVIVYLVSATLLSTVLGYKLFYMGLRHVTASTSNFLELIAPIVAIALGMMFLGETMNHYQMFAFPVLLGSIFMLSQK